MRSFVIPTRTLRTTRGAWAPTATERVSVIGSPASSASPSNASVPGRTASRGSEYVLW